MKVYISLYSTERFQNKLSDISPIEFREKVAS
ncbi:IS3 family transposase [Paenibacillus sp. OK076]